MGTDPLEWIQFSGAGVYVGSSTITLDGNSFKFRDSVGLSVVGRSINTTGEVGDIIASSDDQVLRRSGTSIGFGAINLASNNAVTNTLPVERGGSGATTLSGILIGNGTNPFTAVSGTSLQYLRGDGTLETFPTIGNGSLTLQTTGIASGGTQTFTANQTTGTTFTVNVPGTNISQGTRTSTTVPINSSTGTGGILDPATSTFAGVMTASDKSKLDSIAIEADKYNNWKLQAGTGATTDITSGLTVTFSASSPLNVTRTTRTIDYSFLTQTANTIFAGPVSGVTSQTPTFRTLVPADIPNLDTSKITSGTFNVDRIPVLDILTKTSGTLSVGRGGTGASTLTGVVIGNGTSAMTSVAGTANQLLRRNSTNTGYEFFTHDFAPGSGSTNYIQNQFISAQSSSEAWLSGRFQAGNLRIDTNTITNQNINENIILFTTGSGNIGINTTSPTNTLDINGTLKIRTINNSTGDFLTVDSNGVVTRRTGSEILSDINITGTTNFLSKFTSTGLTDSRIFDDGTNIGINTTTPDSILNIVNTLSGVTNVLNVEGLKGQLLLVTDSLEGVLFSVNDISGIPILEVSSDNTVKLGTFGSEGLIVSGSTVNVRTPIASSSITHIPVFTTDPSTNNVLLESVTPSTLLTNLNAVPTGRTLTLSGTTNQVNVSSPNVQDLSDNRTWTLSLPQDIHTGATPTFAGLTVNGNIGLRASSGSTSTHIPVFTADPTSTTRTLVTRTPAQLLGDIGAVTNTLASANIFVGNSSNIATATALTLNATGGTFALSNTGELTFPNASTNTRGLLTSADWNTFNSKENVLTFSTGLSRSGNTITNTITQYTDALARASISLTTTGTTGSATYNSTTGVFNIPQYQGALTNPVTGTGTAEQVSFWTGTTTQTGDSKLTFNSSTGLLTLNGDLQLTGAKTITTNTDVLTLATGGGNGNIILSPNGTGNVGINTTTPTEKLDINGNVRIRTLGTTAGDVITANVNGVLSRRTSSELLNDIGAVPTGRTLTLSGTTNQVNISSPNIQDLSGDRTWTLSLPQDIHTGATPTFAGLTLNGNLSLNKILLSNQENLDVDSGATRIIGQVSSSIYQAVFFDFVIKKGNNMRAGTIYSIYNGTDIEFTETSTNDIGDTSEVVLSVDVSGGNIRLVAVTQTNDWSIKTLIRGL